MIFYFQQLGESICYIMFSGDNILHICSSIIMYIRIYLEHTDKHCTVKAGLPKFPNVTINTAMTNLLLGARRKGQHLCVGIGRWRQL